MKHFNDITKNLKGLHYGTALRPSRDWLVVLTLTFVLMLASVAWNLWTFAKVTGGEPIGTEAPQQTAGTASTDEVVKLFEERAAEEARYRNDYRFVDPSGTGR
ncbi:MAG: hypothetical protein QOE22_505 [Candidatus Parcubacteria bacterium]|jgi:hypothetical protein|nr:hypothetical protein [Candidatus Parcubacteria bacterium]